LSSIETTYRDRLDPRCLVVDLSGASPLAAQVYVATRLVDLQCEMGRNPTAEVPTALAVRTRTTTATLSGASESSGEFMNHVAQTTLTKTQNPRKAGKP
jgi:hypothetical protein